MTDKVPFLQGMYNVSPASCEAGLYDFLSKMMFVESAFFAPTLTLTQTKCGLKVSSGDYHFTG